MRFLGLLLDVWPSFAENVKSDSERDFRTKKRPRLLLNDLARPGEVKNLAAHSRGLPNRAHINERRLNLDGWRMPLSCRGVRLADLDPGIAAIAAGFELDGAGKIYLMPGSRRQPRPGGRS